jgi:dCMP deaminase
MIDHDWMKVACQVARDRSDDPRTQNAAVLVAADGRYAVSANRLPHRIARHASRLYSPAKYDYLEHAERAAIYAAAAAGIATEGGTLYCPWFACTECARAIILTGIKEVVGLAGHRNATPARWLENIETAEAMLEEAGVGMRWMTSATGVTITFDGRPFPC